MLLQMVTGSTLDHILRVSLDVQSGLRHSRGTFFFLLTVSVLLRAKANMRTSPPPTCRHSVGGFLLLFTHWEGPFLEGSQIFGSF